MGQKVPCCGRQQLLATTNNLQAQSATSNQWPSIAMLVYRRAFADSSFFPSEAKDNFRHKTSSPLKRE